MCIEFGADPLKFMAALECLAFCDYSLGEGTLQLLSWCVCRASLLLNLSVPVTLLCNIAIVTDRAAGQRRGKKVSY